MIRSCVALFLSVLLLSACSVAPVSIVDPAPVTGDEMAKSASPQVAGKVTVGKDKIPVAGIRIGAWPIQVDHLRDTPPFVSALTGEDGLFSLDLPTGSYYFIAEGAGLYSFYGRNPVMVAETGVAGLNLSLLQRNPQPVAVEAGVEIETGLFGHVYHAGKPVAGVVVTVYPDLNSQLKGQGLGMTVPTDASGYFEAQLSPGTYYLVARKRQSGSFMGPLQAGDYFGYFADNPLLIRAGQVPQVPMALLEVPEKVARIGGSIFGDTSISGKIYNNSGQPVAGIRVLLYDNPMMLNRPLYVSQPTAADGRYVISFPRGGTYWLAARNQLGGPPLPGQLYGRYLGSPDGSVRLVTGKSLPGIELTIEEMK